MSTIYVYPLGSLNPLCVKHGINTVISPGTLAAVETMPTCTPSPAPGGSYVIKVVTARGAEYAYVVTTSPTQASAGGGGGISCSFAPSGGKRFGSPDGSPASGFNELNGWVAAWGPSGGGVRIALMPGITPPDSTDTGARYTVELNNVQIGTLTVSGGTASVSITEPMPGFMQVVRIWLEPGGHVLYDNGPRPAVDLAPGTYQVYATLRVAPRSDVYGSATDLTLTCGGSPTATITQRVPDPNEWGLRVDIYTIATYPPSWPPFVGADYTYRGTWSVGGIYLWLYRTIPSDIDRLNLRSPYFTSAIRTNTAPKWAAYWIDPAATEWRQYALKYTGGLYVPWSSIRVGVWHDDGVYVRLCSIDTGSSRWFVTAPVFYATSGTCTGAPGVYSVEVGFFDAGTTGALVLIIGPVGADVAYVPTIDGAWFCPNFDWTQGTCSAAWSFVPASSAVPHFRGTNYTPSSTDDGGGTPLP